MNTTMLYYRLKAQFTLWTLMMVFIMLIVFSKMYPTIKELIDDLIPQVDELTAILVSLIPFIVVSAIIMTIWFYVIPHRQAR